MIRYVAIVLLSGAGLTAFSQAGPTSATALPPSVRIVRDDIWLRDLYDLGVDNSGDSLRIGPESRRVLTNANYRQMLYPTHYTWPQTVQLLKQMEIKKALWFLLNIYASDPASRELAIRTVLAYEEVCETDRALLAAFYTYAFMDPAVSAIKNGKLTINRPDLLEAKLKITREMIAYILNYRRIKPK